MLNRLKEIIWSFLISTLAGLLGFVVEILVGAQTQSLEVRMPFVLYSLLPYGLVFGVIGILVGLSVPVLERLFRRRGSGFDRRKFFLVFSVFAMTLILGGGWLNFLYVPQVFSLFSVVANGALLIVVLAAFLFVHRFIQSVQVPFKTAFLIFLTVLIILTALTARYILREGAPGRSIAAEGSAQSTGKPNVLIIVVDSLRPDHLSCYGYSRETSPTIDQVASQGARFTNAYAQSGHTVESVPSILTSLYPSTHGIDSFYSALPSGSLTIFSLAKRHGFITSIFSETPTLTRQYGWDEKNGIDTNSSAQSRRGFSIISYYFRLLHLTEKIYSLLPNFTREPAPTGETKDTVSRFLEFLDGVDDHPFISYIHLMDVHEPYEPKGEYRDLFARPFEQPRIKVRDLNRGFYPFDSGSRVSDRQLQDILDRYDETIRLVDQERLVKIIGGLEQKGLLEKTLIVITADHGEEFYEHEQWFHSTTLFRTLVRVPLIIKLPGQDGPAKRIDEVVRLVDIVPTILDLWDVPKPALLEGQSVIPLIEGNGWVPQSAYSELHLKGKSCFSLLQDGYHFIQVRFGLKESLMLFDLKDDPDERRNLADENQDMTAAMLAKLKEINKVSKKKSIATKDIELSREVEERLKSLGYIK
jgi:arylsulfatase